MFTLQSGTYHGRPFPFETVDTDTIPDYLWPGGYAVEYVTPDGDILCGKCTRDAFTDESSADYDNAMAGQLAGPCEVHDSEHSTGLMCDGCNEWIVEPHCVECSTDYDPRDLFVDDSRSVLMCPDCLAKEVVNETAVKTGKRTYQLTGDQWYRVNHPTVFSR